MVWIGLAVLGTALVGGAAYAAVHGLAAYRTLRRAGRELTGGLERVSRDSAALTAKLEALATGSERLEAALERLRVSRARLNVLLEAVRQVRAGIARVTGVVPRKG
jgi:predicted nuclease with TOPRIM domain